jgi:spore coat polysaccharide biosynthesis protein SpsF
MSHLYPTDQEEFWAGEFGDMYIERNQGEGLLATKTAHLARALSHAHRVQTIIEFGCNIGLNLIALRRLLPDAEAQGLEINDKAARLAERAGFPVIRRSILGYRADRLFDLVLVSGLLMHLDPQTVPDAYDALYSACGRYLCIFEYYNPEPVGVVYRGEQDRLFKRDWAGDLLDRFSDLDLVDYGFVYRRDNQFPGDDVNWFLLERC